MNPHQARVMIAFFMCCAAVLIAIVIGSTVYNVAALHIPTTQGAKP